MARSSPDGQFLNFDKLGKGVTQQNLAAGIDYVYDTLDMLDEQLLLKGLPRMAGLVELANLSSIIGNILSSGIVASSQGVFSRAGPHKYQDLRTTGRDPTAANIEVKVALETNNPKGHLAKSGDYLTCRYVLADAQGKFSYKERKVSLVKESNPDETKDVRITAPDAKAVKQLVERDYTGWVLDTEPIRAGEIVWIWEVRFGYLEESHFNISNTEGDSGKTAVVNAEGMKQLKIVYVDKRLSPYTQKSQYWKTLNTTFGDDLFALLD